MQKLIRYSYYNYYNLSLIFIKIYQNLYYNNRNSLMKFSKNLNLFSWINWIKYYQRIILRKLFIITQKFFYIKFLNKFTKKNKIFNFVILNSFGYTLWILFEYIWINFIQVLKQNHLYNSYISIISYLKVLINFLLNEKYYNKNTIHLNYNEYDCL
jgi:hypothetical protein